MPDLLDLAMAAHGGLPRWRELRGLKFRVSSGGLLFDWKWQRRTLNGLEGFVDCSRPRAMLSNYPEPGHRGVFHPAVVRIETHAGEVVRERRAPRLAFASTRRALFWDHLDLLYFAGYAIWNYLCAPFLLASPGFATEEVSPWREGNEEWRRLRVRFPPEVPTHSQEQVFYFDTAGLLRRLDYTAEVVGSWAKAAHYCHAPKEFSGLMVPTRRRVVPRRADNVARSGPTLVWIDVAEVAPVASSGRMLRPPAWRGETADS
ncbi:MAG: hypothetical protein ACLPJH_09510 [Myxococcaceae bacterium]